LKNASIFCCGIVIFGGAEGIRTPDLLRAREALSQLSYSPIITRASNVLWILALLKEGVKSLYSSR
jgi:hypothetical protein